MQWIFNNKIFKEENIPEGSLGFTYKITITDKASPHLGKFYIGKKAFKHKSTKRISKRVIKETGTRKRKEVTQKDSGWKTYTGSSKVFNEMLKECKSFKKEILSFYPTKSSLSLGEIQAIICEGDWLSEKCMNGWVSCKIYKNQLK